MSAKLLCKSFTYVFKNYLISFFYYEGKNTVDVRFTCKNSIQCVYKSEHDFDIPNELAQLDYINKNFESFKEEFKNLKYDVVL